MEEPTSLIDDAEFSLPPEFLTDDDFLVEKENKGDRFRNCLFPYESSHGFELDLDFGSTVKPIGDKEKLLAGLSRKMAQSSLEDDLSGGFFRRHAFSTGNNGTKAWDSTRRVAVGCRNQNCQTQVSSQTVVWDRHYAGGAEELTLMNINGYNNHNGRGLLDLPRKHQHPLAAAKITNAVSSYYNRQSLHYHKLQAIQFLKQQQLMQQSRGLVGANDNNKIAATVDLSTSAWSNQPQRPDVFLQTHRTGNRGSTGTGVFLPRCVNHATAEKPMLATVLVPARVVPSPSLNDGSWKQRMNNSGFSNQIKMEQPVNDPRLPSDWAY
ncbi:Uncharacterized protein Rs2_35329 [Raphanus sativus]|uniref:Uncharacterized protein LOC108830231 n=1 Tax=Raphanus sativus TaxID=3726 RepID=A0A6J0LI58_RAPSA|nr:uncharacterized protein LOC108830231 [Raphanus sativus]KAJ4885236.1 Uncharacterized protein Rs2_35329 [Raphanus sativus]